jgi:hypothetical protein
MQTPYRAAAFPSRVISHDIRTTTERGIELLASRESRADVGPIDVGDDRIDSAPRGSADFGRVAATANPT